MDDSTTKSLLFLGGALIAGVSLSQYTQYTIPAFVGIMIGAFL